MNFTAASEATPSFGWNPSRSVCQPSPGFPGGMWGGGGQVRSGQVRSGQVGSGRVGSGRAQQGLFGVCHSTLMAVSLI
eukprot:748741-Prorocentrum_minimum.AAC.1